jgi:hypothetical protein
MGFFHATHRRMITSYTLTGGIVVLIILVRMTPQPWRGIIDLGVVLGLVWGMLAIVLFAIRALASRRFDFATDLPGS